MALFPRLPAVALAAKHLAVFGDGSSAFVPRRDVVGLHLIQLEMFAADFANAALLFIDFALGVGVEGADAEVAFVAVEDVIVT